MLRVNLCLGHTSILLGVEEVAKRVVDLGVVVMVHLNQMEEVAKGVVDLGVVVVVHLNQVEEVAKGVVHLNQVEEVAKGMVHVKQVGEVAKGVDLQNPHTLLSIYHQLELQLML